MFHKVPGIEKIDGKEGGGGREYHVFRSQLFSLTVPKIFVGEPFSVFLISCMEKFYAYEGSFTIFYGNFFCLTVPKNFIVEPLHVSQKFWFRKVFMDKIGGREYHNFPSKLFCLTLPRNLVGEPFSVSLISGIENFYAYAGIFTIFY